MRAKFITISCKCQYIPTGNCIKLFLLTSIRPSCCLFQSSIILSTTNHKISTGQVNKKLLLTIEISRANYFPDNHWLFSSYKEEKTSNNFPRPSCLPQCWQKEENIFFKVELQQKSVIKMFLLPSPIIWKEQCIPPYSHLRLSEQKWLDVTCSVSKLQFYFHNERERGVASYQPRTKIDNSSEHDEKTMRFRRIPLNILRSTYQLDIDL